MRLVQQLPHLSANGDLVSLDRPERFLLAMP